MSDGNSTPKTPSSVRSVRSTSTTASQAIKALCSGEDKHSSSNLKVINEETFLDEMGKIIERDFFPDIMDVRSQLGVGPSLPMPAVSSVVRSPDTSTFRRPSRYSPGTSRSVSLRKRTLKATALLEPKINPNLTLNQFLDTYTSEENHNLYKKLKDDSDKFHRIKFKWLYEKKNSMIDSAFSPSPVNALMFHPPGLKAEKSNQLGICYRNARTLKTQNLEASAAKIKAVAVAPVQAAPLATPSPCPGEDGTPIITWGEIKSTPLLLQPSATPVPTPLLQQTPGTPRPTVPDSTNLLAGAPLNN